MTWIVPLILMCLVPYRHNDTRQMRQETVGFYKTNQTAVLKLLARRCMTQSSSCLICIMWGLNDHFPLRYADCRLLLKHLESLDPGSHFCGFNESCFTNELNQLNDIHWTLFIEVKSIQCLLLSSITELQRRQYTLRVLNAWVRIDMPLRKSNK